MGREYDRKLSAFRFGVRLQELREFHGLSRPELAERSGVARAAIWKLEKGLREPLLTTILALADALEIEPSMLLAPFGWVR